jgi:IS5 family transposase
VSWTRSSGRKPNQIEGAGQEPALAKAGVEHPIGIIKRVFGFAKVRYRGLKKNAHRLLVTCALANLFMARRHLLRCQVA